MAPGGMRVTRALPIDGPFLDAVVLKLRRDASGPTLSWTLGPRGSAELDTAFARDAGAWTTGVRLWSGSGLAVAAATLTLTADGTAGVLVTLQPTLPAAAAWGDDGCDLEELGRAVVDELAEELLWHASRTGLAPSS